MSETETSEEIGPGKDEFEEIRPEPDKYRKLIRRANKRISRWKAPLIVADELWERVTEAFLDVYFQHENPVKRPVNLAVYGNTDTGKTTYFDHFIPALREEERLDRFGIIQISCYTNSTLKGLYQAMLDELDWKYSKHDSIQYLEGLLRKAVIKRRCQLIVIDEFSQLITKTTADGEIKSQQPEARQAEILKALRNIPIQTLCPLVIIGTRDILRLLEKDSQTNNRFLKVEFPRFELGWGNWILFQKTIAALDAKLRVDTGIISDFAQKMTILAKLYQESKGKMGSLIKIYELAVKLALKNGKKPLNSSLIDKAVKILNQNHLLHDDDPVIVDIPENWWKTDPN
ncbi:MAG: TniB family NTP-binding protein [Candidatus Heimdallarchaeota archaeon]